MPMKPWRTVRLVRATIRGDKVCRGAPASGIVRSRRFFRVMGTLLKRRALLMILPGEAYTGRWSLFLLLMSPIIPDNLS
jgi:hypothetical protein